MGKSKIFNMIAIVLLVAGLVSIGTAFDKKNNYVNNEYFSLGNVNAYVGGDAYNYIINSNYFTGYIVLGAVSCLASVILFSTSALMQSKNNEYTIKNNEHVKEENENIPVENTENKDVEEQ